MINYDQIAADYDSYRGDEVGVASIGALIHQLGKDIAVLDLGCGTGKPIAMHFAEKVREYVGVDSSAGMIQQFSSQVHPAKSYTMRLEDLTMSGKRFELVFSWGAMCHLQPNIQKIALSKAVSLTAANGLIAFTSGEHQGQAQGSVGELLVTHHSLGVNQYDRIMQALGCIAVSKGFVEGGFYLYVYRKTVDEIPTKEGSESVFPNTDHTQLT